MMRFLASLFLAAAALPCLADEIHTLPKLEVTADVIAAMIPCDQVRAISDYARDHCPSFELSTITVLKAPRSKFSRPIRCFIRGTDGHVLEEITNEDLLFPLDPHWPAGFLSSNQPDEYSAFYFMLKPRFDSSRITIGEIEKLLSDYTAFSEYYLDEARRSYAGTSFIELRWATVPDQILLLADSPRHASIIAQRVGVMPDGNAVTIGADQIATLKAQHGSNYIIADRALEIVGRTIGRLSDRECARRRRVSRRSGMRDSSSRGGGGGAPAPPPPPAAPPPPPPRPAFTASIARCESPGCPPRRAP